MKFIVIKLNIATAYQRSFLDTIGISLRLSLLGWNVLREQCTPCKTNKDAFLTEHSHLSDDYFTLSMYEA